MLASSSTSTAAPRRLLYSTAAAAATVRSSSGVRHRAIASAGSETCARSGPSRLLFTTTTYSARHLLQTAYCCREDWRASFAGRVHRSSCAAIRHKSSQAQTTSNDARSESNSTSHKSSANEEHKQELPPPYPSAPARQPFAAAQPPPRQHGAPRLIRYPPPDAEAVVPPPASPSDTQPTALYTYSRGPSSRLFSYRNAASAARATRRANPFARSPQTYYWPTTSTSSTLSSSFEPVPSSSSSSVKADSPSNNTPDAMSAQASGVEASAGSAGMTTRGRGNGKLEAEQAASARSHAAREHDHDHAGHAHGIFGGHSHSHGSEGSAEEADKLLAALKGKGDRGSNITVVGLIANLVLCGAKGAAGVLLHSASLLADAAHSLSDTFSDLVTLFCWKMSQKPASLSHPLGYGKFETMGGLGVSLVLVAGSVAIGLHSYGLLLEVLQPHLQHMPAGLQSLSSLTGDIARAAGGILHEHSHSHSAAMPVATRDAASQVLTSAGGTAGAAQAASDHGVLDPNAMWFALISILVKEWLYRATLKIAREENSSVLEANAIHHRSDSLSSGVTFLAIGGSYLGFPVLDPLGGLLVAGLIGKQGAELLIGALNDLSDRGVQSEVLDDFENVLRGIIDEPTSSSLDADSARLLGWKDLRAVRSGVSTFVDVTLLLAADTPLRRAQVVESRVRDAITNAHKGVKEVRVRLEPQQ